ncbi:UNVERIFIED_CONTAM: putative WRKY transcription factor 14 [Sesamum latifolium]|uniref:WRKY transcription factor 14 n=1 Tax=Sesamum latifolium TaxID=2727402 RepID=A0AAW2Y214_9LAMI
MQEIDQTELESNLSSRTENHASKKRKMGERVVVAVKIAENDKKQQRNEGRLLIVGLGGNMGKNPSKDRLILDLFAIEFSFHFLCPPPNLPCFSFYFWAFKGYYRCSTSKGCSAKEQVERCKTDASMLIITYTSTHNHPGPDFSLPTNQKQEEKEIDSAPESTDTQPTTPKQEQEAELMPQETPVNNCEHKFQYSQSPFNSTTTDHIIVNQENPFQENLETHGGVYSEDPKSVVSHDAVELSSLLKPEENDFYDELEELPRLHFSQPS